MVCNDRQLTDAQRAAAFEQNRNAGALKAIRPFTGEATPENLVDYLNREVFPVLKQARTAVNEIYRQVTDNAPSGNPLGYIFSTIVVDADPGPGFMRLNAATQETATIIRVSEQNQQLKTVVPWLDVMAGSATAPLGVVTLFTANDPSRFIRWNLDTMTDQGTYWNLGVTFVESSHDNPFVDEDQVVLAFIPGVASTGTTVPPSSVTSTWADILANGVNTGAFNPTIDSGQRVIFAGAGASPAGGDIDAAGDLTLDSVGDMHLHPHGALHLGHSAITSLVHVEASAEIDLTAGADILAQAVTSVAVQAGTFYSVSTGAVPRLTVEDDGSWNIGGSNGTDGQYLRSFGSLAPPQWATIAFSEITGGTWADVLSRGNNSGAFNPHIDDGQFLSFGIEASIPASGDIRSSDAFTINVTGLATFTGSTQATLSSGGNGFAAAPSAVSAVAGTSAISILDDGFIRLTTGGTERLEIEATGAWQLGGLVGTAGQYMRSSGAGASPAWATISVGELGAIAAESFLGNFTAGAAAPAARAGSSVAGAGLTYTAGGTLAVGAGTRITVNADDVQLAAGAAESFLMNATAGSAVADYRAGSSVAGAGLTYTAGGTLAVGAGTGITVNANDVQLSTLIAESFFGNFTAGAAVGTARAGSSVAGAGLTYTAGGTLAVGAGTGVTVNANDVQLTTIADDTFMANVSGAAAVATGKTFTSLAGASIDYDATNHELDYVGTTSEINLVSISGNQGTVDISTLECGGCVNVSAAANWSIEGFTAKTDGFWFTLSANNADFFGTLFDDDATATATNRMRLTTEVDFSAVAIQAILYYAESRWRVIVGGRNRPTVLITSGTINAAALAATDVAIQLSATSTLNGIANGFEGREIDVYCATSGTLTANHASGSAAATDQIFLAGGVAYGPQARGGMRLRYDATNSVWREVARAENVTRLLEVHSIFSDDASITITPPAAATWFEFEIVGAGGGGGGADVSGTNEASAGSGGGGGEYVRGIVAIVSGNITGSVGNSGAAGSNAGTSGSDGGDTVLTYNAVSYTADGGHGGAGVAAAGGAVGTTAEMQASVGTAAGGSNGTASTADIWYFAGSAGEKGLMFVISAIGDCCAVGGNGGGSHFSPGSQGQGGVANSETSAAGGNGVNAGAGGGGAAATGDAANIGAAGGVGADGCMIVRFYSGPVPTRSVIS